MKYKIEDIEKAVKLKGFKLIKEGTTDYYIADKIEYAKIANEWKSGIKLIRISNSKFYLNDVIYHSRDDATNISIIHEDTKLGGFNYYRFIPASWVTPKKSHLPEWL